jgi:DNA-binding Lrp family transcriptional regulator
MSFTEISKKAELSVDAVRKRIKKMQKEGIFYSKIQLRPRHFGFSYVVDVKLKLRNYNGYKIRKFIDYTVNHPRIVEVFAISGDWDFTIVFVSKDHEDLAEISNEIREKFSDIIGGWSESLTTVAYKFEEYRFPEILEYQTKKMIS